ncbi:MAG: hypothetical protein GY866_35885 [Proteobacteria bacterium]|nr:hypothetical protein [Pseudomonadota bacterium]
MSHELRTPLHGILGFATLGAERVHTSSSEKLHGFFSEILSSGNRLLNLLNDLLDLSKLEAGKVNYHFSERRFRNWFYWFRKSLRPYLRLKMSRSYITRPISATR